MGKLKERIVQIAKSGIVKELAPFVFLDNTRKSIASNEEGSPAGEVHPDIKNGWVKKVLMIAIVSLVYYLTHTGKIDADQGEIIKDAAEEIIKVLPVE